MPLVSVVIPAYNVAPYLAHCLDSVLAQTVQDFEILVVDDGSTDQTSEVVGQYTDSRVHLLADGINHGRSWARNVAIQAAQGEWLALLDADDWWLPQRLERLLSLAHQFAADMVMDDLAVVTNGRQQPYTTAFRARHLRLAAPAPVTAEEFVDYDLGIGQPLIRRSRWVEAGVHFGEHLRHGEEDFPALLTYLLAGGRCVLTPDALYCYRLRPGSATSQRIQLFTASRAATLNLLDDPAVASRATVVAALLRRLQQIDGILAYNRWQNHLHNGQYGAGIQQLVSDPRLWHFVLYRLRMAVHASRVSRL